MTPSDYGVIRPLGHDSIPLKVILLFPPLLVSPSRGFQGGNLWLSDFFWSVVGSLSPRHLAFFSLLWSRLVPRALFGAFCLALFVSPGTLWLSEHDLVLLFLKTSGKILCKNLRKIISRFLALSGLLFVLLVHFVYMFPLPYPKNLRKNPCF